jgi:DNA-binding response OmpR family regulator
MQPRPIVVINDSAELLALVGEVLREDEGYAVTTLRSEETTARDVLGARPALVIIDLLLPATAEGLSGWELLEELLDDSALVNVPFVVTSAAVDALREREPALQRRENLVVLLKPFSVRELTAVVDRLLGR